MLQVTNTRTEGYYKERLRNIYSVNVGHYLRVVESINYSVRNPFFLFISKTEEDFENQRYSVTTTFRVAENTGGEYRLSRHNHADQLDN